MLFLKSKSKGINILLAIIICTFSNKVHAQEKLYDSVAIKLLDKMSSFLGDLSACSVKIQTIQEDMDVDYGALIHDAMSTVVFSGNNKFQVISDGHKGHFGLWYNGAHVTYYSFSNNHFGMIDSVPETTIDMIDMVHNKYDFDFPAADLFYPTFTDDLMAEADRIEYLGKVSVKGNSYYEVVARGKGLTMQLWITDDAYFLPARMIIRNLDRPGSYYEVNLSEWQFNVSYPDAFFEFNRPPYATPLTIMPKSK